MDFARHEYFFSQIRLSRYLRACNNDAVKAIQLYKCNIQASQTLYPLISIVEVSLRNGIDRELSKQFSASDWLLTQRNKFANHPNMTKRDKRGIHTPDHFFTEKLQKAEQKLMHRQIQFTHGKLLAELTFGFWVKFYDSSPIKVLKGAPLNVFKNKPSMKAAKVHSHLNSLVTLRNRISHNEPICFDAQGNICLNTIRTYEANISEALNWIDSDLKRWADKMNFFQPVFTRISLI